MKYIKINSESNTILVKLTLFLIGVSNIIIMIAQTYPRINTLSIIVQIILALLLYRGTRWVRILFIVASFLGFFVIFTQYNGKQYPIVLLITIQLLCIFSFLMLTFNKKILRYFHSCKSPMHMD